MRGERDEPEGEAPAKRPKPSRLGEAELMAATAVLRDNLTYDIARWKRSHPRQSFEKGLSPEWERKRVFMLAVNVRRFVPVPPWRRIDVFGSGGLRFVSNPKNPGTDAVGPWTVSLADGTLQEGWFVPTPERPGTGHNPIFTNFYPGRVKYDLGEYAMSEIAFQAAKYGSYGNATDDVIDDRARRFVTRSEDERAAYRQRIAAEWTPERAHTLERYRAVIGSRSTSGSASMALAGKGADVPMHDWELVLWHDRRKRVMTDILRSKFDPRAEPASLGRAPRHGYRLPRGGRRREPRAGHGTRRPRRKPARARADGRPSGASAERRSPVRRRERRAGVQRLVPAAGGSATESERLEVNLRSIHAVYYRAIARSWSVGGRDGAATHGSVLRGALVSTRKAARNKHACHAECLIQ